MKITTLLPVLSVIAISTTAIVSPSFSTSHSSAELEPRVFDKELTAVVHAMNTYNPLSIHEDREYIGAIYKLSRGTGYLYSVAPGSKGSDQISATIPKLNDAQIVGFWHTHGKDHWTRRYFSNIDTQLVEQWQLPFYMGCADGQLRVFRPGDRLLGFRQAQLRGLGKANGYALGQLIPDLQIST